MLIFLVILSRHVDRFSCLIDRDRDRGRLGGLEHRPGLAPGQVDGEGQRQHTAATGHGEFEAVALRDLGRTQGHRYSRRQFKRLGEDPRSGLLDRQLVRRGDLELNLNREVVAILDSVEGLEVVMNGVEVAAQLTHLSLGHQGLR